MASSESSLARQTEAFIHSEGLVSSWDDRLLVAVSGGVDSMVLVSILNRLGFRLAVAHCNFQLRGEASEADSGLVEEWANSQNVPFFRENFEPKAYAAEKGISLQMAARTLRYDWFEKLRKAHGYQWIVTAHHRDDLIETVLINLTRGTGIKGLQGILPKQGQTIRPLLFADKATLMAYAREQNIQWREDISNQSTHYQRNYLRHEVIPRLASFNPAFESKLYESIQHFRDLNAFWESIYRKAWHQLVHEQGIFWYLPLQRLKTLYPLRLYLHAFLYPLGFNPDQLKAIQSGLEKHDQSGKMFFAEHYQLEVGREWMIIGPYPLPEVDYLIDAIPGTHQIGGYEFKIDLLGHKENPDFQAQNAVYLDWDKFENFPKFRTWQEGDCFYPLGMKNPKKLSDFFVDKHFARLEKARTLILATKKGQIAWVVGARIDERFKVTENTEKMLGIRYSILH